MRLLCKMKKKGITPNVMTYNAAISVYEKGGQCKETDNLERRSIEEGLFKNYSLKESSMSKLYLHDITLDIARDLVCYFADQLYKNRLPGTGFAIIL